MTDLFLFSWCASPYLSGVEHSLGLIVRSESMKSEKVFMTLFRVTSLDTCFKILYNNNNNNNNTYHMPSSLSPT
jgi:hypothetical protein